MSRQGGSYIVDSEGAEPRRVEYTRTPHEAAQGAPSADAPTLRDAQEGGPERAAGEAAKTAVDQAAPAAVPAQTADAPAGDDPAPAKKRK